MHRILHTVSSSAPYTRSPVSEGFGLVVLQNDFPHMPERPDHNRILANHLALALLIAKRRVQAFHCDVHVLVFLKLYWSLYEGVYVQCWLWSWAPGQMIRVGFRRQWSPGNWWHRKTPEPFPGYLSAEMRMAWSKDSPKVVDSFSFFSNAMVADCFVPVPK